MSTFRPTPLQTIERDVLKASATLGRDEARYLVDTFYALQGFRIASTNQVRSITRSETEEPHETLRFFGDQFDQLENEIKRALDHYSSRQVMGVWAREHTGIGPVIAAGLLAHIDLTEGKTPSASSLWRFAGLAPGQRKVKGQKRDWNASLKVLCFKIGDSFRKFSNHPDCYYGKLYRERKQYEVELDVAGKHAEQAREVLKLANIREPKVRATYESGHLPDGHLDARARRFAVKRFLLHYFQAAWWDAFGTPPPNPYVQAHLGHVHMEPCPVPFPIPAGVQVPREERAA